MRARIERDALRAAVKTVLPATTTKTQLAVLSCVRLSAVEDTLILTTSDLDLTIRVEVDADIETEGVALAPAGLLSRVLDKTPDGSVELALSDDLLHVLAGEVEASLHTMSVADWPQLRDEAPEMTELTAEHVDLLSRVVLAAGTNMARPPLWCVHLEGNRAAASDDHRVMVATLEGATFESALIPAVTVSAAMRGATGPVALGVTTTEACFSSGRKWWTVRTVNDRVPPYERVLRDESPHHLAFAADRMVEALDRAQAIAGPNPVRLARDGDELVVSRSDYETGEIKDIVPCSGDFEEEIGFNLAHLRQAIQLCRTEQVTLEVVDSLKSAVLRSPHLSQAVMPMKLLR